MSSSKWDKRLLLHEYFCQNTKNSIQFDSKQSDFDCIVMNVKTERHDWMKFYYWMNYLIKETVYEVLFLEIA